jgi:hypothetical protein
MPKVGSGKSAKHYSYTTAGRAAAKKEAKRTGKSVTNTRKPKKKKYLCHLYHLLKSGYNH